MNLAYVEGLGAVVTEIFNKAAAEGGLCAGDVILSIGSQPIATAVDAKNALKCVLGEAELQVSRIESKDGLPRGWKASTDAASGRTVYWRMVQSADGKQWLPRYSHQHPALCARPPAARRRRRGAHAAVDAARAALGDFVAVSCFFCE